MSLGPSWLKNYRIRSGRALRTRNGLGDRDSRGKRRGRCAEMPEKIAVSSLSDRVRELAGRQGVSAVAARNPKKHGGFGLINVSDARQLRSSDSFHGFRPFAAIFRFCWRDVTRNVTRRERLPSSSRREIPHAITPACYAAADFGVSARISRSTFSISSGKFMMPAATRA